MQLVITLFVQSYKYGTGSSVSEVMAIQCSDRNQKQLLGGTQFRYNMMR